ncbi:hypothetical protein FPQ18DRAFT_351004 [Pyronema domesticum]|nr:hypothetical protein FPQ18DRAFT_351004 [Pyronema domesticum]
MPLFVHAYILFLLFSLPHILSQLNPPLFPNQRPTRCTLCHRPSQIHILLIQLVPLVDLSDNCFNPLVVHHINSIR